MPLLKITNPFVSPQFVQELQDEPAYRSAKTFSATHAFLRQVRRFSRNQEYATIHATDIKEWFGNYNIPYLPCLEALENHGLLKIDRQYIVGHKPRGYKLTEKGSKLMYKGQMQYLKKLFTDRSLKRQIQKKESYLRIHGQKYTDDFLQYIHEGRMHYKFDQAAVKCIAESNWPNLTRLDAVMSLIDFAKRDFVELKCNDSDNRCWNEFAGMKSELRKFFSLGNLKYRYLMDIRSCHPLFLAHYLMNCAQIQGWQSYHPLLPGDHQKTIFEIDSAQERERSERFSIPIPPTITKQSTTYPFPSNSHNPGINNYLFSHYVGGNSDIQAELRKWNQIFSDPTRDPKAMLYDELGYQRDTAKAALNHTINGSNQYKRFKAWFKKGFPKLFAIWERTNKATVGTGISAQYETWLMQDMELYNLATQLGLHLTYEFDGCGVMCREDDPDVLAKIQQLVQHIQDRSERRWNIRPVIVVKSADGALVNMQDHISSLAPDQTE